MSTVTKSGRALAMFEEVYRGRTRNSWLLYERGCQSLPGGVGGDAKLQAPYPIYLQEAKGQTLVDIDGNRYLDTLYGAGSCILGHSPDEVIKATCDQAARVVAAAVPTELEIELGEKIKAHMPALEMVRFANSGSEATAMAVRAARAFTGKKRIAKFEGHYHGQWDEVLVSGASAYDGEPQDPIGAPECPGLHPAVVESTVVLPFNDIDSTRRILAELADDVACVLVEPMAGFGLGGIPADREFLIDLRELTRDLDILLLFDEIVTGFRLGLGGAQGAYGIEPDLTTLGKALAGGYPIGVYGGRRDVMERTVSTGSSKAGKIFQSGTFTGNPVSCAAALVTLHELEKPGTFEHLDRLGTKVRDGLAATCDRLGLPAQVTGLASTFNLHFNAAPIRNKRDTLESDHLMQQAFVVGCLANGAYMRRRQVGFVCRPQTDEDVSFLLDVAGDVLSQLA